MINKKYIYFSSELFRKPKVSTTILILIFYTLKINLYILYTLAYFSNPLFWHWKRTNIFIRIIFEVKWYLFRTPHKHKPFFFYYCWKLQYVTPITYSFFHLQYTKASLTNFYYAINPTVLCPAEFHRLSYFIHR